MLRTAKADLIMHVRIQDTREATLQWCREQIEVQKDVLARMSSQSPRRHLIETIIRRLQSQAALLSRGDS